MKPPRFCSLLVLCLMAVSSMSPSLVGQIVPHVRYMGKLLPVVDMTGTLCIVVDEGKRQRSGNVGLEMRPGSGFAEGFAEIGKVVADLDPLKGKSDRERLSPESVRFRYSAEVKAQGNLGDCYGLLTFVSGGSVGGQFVAIGSLRSGQSKTVKVTLKERVDAVGRLHIFANGKEVKSSETKEAYDVKDYWAELTRGEGVPAAMLVQTEKRFPHSITNDGRKLATVRERDTHNSLIIYDLEKMEMLHDIPLGDKGETAWDLTWISEHELAYLGQNFRQTRRSNNLREIWSDFFGGPLNSDLMLLDTTTGKPEKLLDDVARIFNPVHKKPGQLVVFGRKWAFRAGTAIYDTRAREILAKDSLDEGYTYFDENGVARIRFEPNGETQRCFYTPDARSPWRPLDKQVTQAGLSFDRVSRGRLDRMVELHSLGADDDALYIASRVNSDRFELATFSFSEGKITKVLASDPRYDLGAGNEGFSRLLYRKGSSELLGVYYDAEKPKVVWWNPKFAAVQRNMDQAFPNHVNVPQDWSVDGNTFVYYSFNDQDPGTYYILRLDKSMLIPLFVSGEPLKERKLGRMTPLEFTARDGATVYGYVTYPPAENVKNAPLVVYIHGGPMARDSWTFDPVCQFLATRGYIVLQVNYRGSSGYGAAYQKAGLYQPFDTVVIDDIADGVEHLIKSGAADRNRIAVLGGSFGGWATYMSLIKYPQLYRAGVALAAVAHWKSQLSSDRGSNLMGYTFWKDLLKRIDFAAVEHRMDPYLRAAELKQPIYIMHGEDDYTVRLTEAQLMVNALKKTNPHVEFMEFPEEGHSGWSDKTTIKWLGEMDRFLRKHMAPTATMAASNN